MNPREHAPCQIKDTQKKKFLFMGLFEARLIFHPSLGHNSGVHVSSDFLSWGSSPSWRSITLSSQVQKPFLKLEVTTSQLETLGPARCSPSLLRHAAAGYFTETHFNSTFLVRGSGSLRDSVWVLSSAMVAPEWLTTSKLRRWGAKCQSRNWVLQSRTSRSG